MTLAPVNQFTLFKHFGTPSLKARQQGLTLIELMVAMVISLVISLAAISALMIAREGFSTVDAASQLRDNARFASDIIQRITAQTGFKDRAYAAAAIPAAVKGVTPTPNISGFNNALISATDPMNTSTARTSSVVGYGSDILIVRYQTVEAFPGSTTSDMSMIDCSGAAPAALPANRYDRMVSIFHVAIDQGEPTLMCTYSATGAAPFSTVPIVQGVENFQVLYGTDGVVAGTASTEPTTAGTPNAFLRADQLVVAGNQTGTNNNWRRVRSLRIGLIMRGAPNSGQEKTTATLYPFGAGKSSSSATAGSGMSSSNDIGTIFTAPADGRLRQAVTFTVHLRNDQGR